MPVVPALHEFSPDLPRGCSLRVRAAPRSDATQFTVVADGAVVPVVASLHGGLWLRVELEELASQHAEAWMMAATVDGMKLLVPLRPAAHTLSPELPEGCMLRIRAAADSGSATIGTSPGTCA